MKSTAGSACGIELEGIGFGIPEHSQNLGRKSCPLKIQCHKSNSNPCRPPRLRQHLGSSRSDAVISRMCGTQPSCKGRTRSFSISDTLGKQKTAGGRIEMTLTHVERIGNHVFARMPPAGAASRGLHPAQRCWAAAGAAKCGLGSEMRIRAAGGGVEWVGSLSAHLP